MQRVILSETGKRVYENEYYNPHDLNGVLDDNYTPWSDELTCRVTWENGAVNLYRHVELELI